MNQRNQSPIIHLAWRIPQVDITHQASSAKLFATLSVQTGFYWILVCVCLCTHCDICWLCQRFVLQTSNYKFLCIYSWCGCFEHVHTVCVQCGSVTVCFLQENSTLQLQWRLPQMMPYSETNSNTWANVSLPIYTSGISQITALAFKIMSPN